METERSVLTKKIARVAGTTLAIVGSLVLFLSVPGQVYSSYVASRFDPSQSAKMATMTTAPSGEEVSVPGQVYSSYVASRFDPSQSTKMATMTTAPSGEKLGVPGAASIQQIKSLTLSEATWIYIPSIQVDSRVIEIGVKKEKGSWIWEAPAFAVGHYGGTANPGEIGNAVFTGHIRSNPIKEEGSVFGRLPEIELGHTVYLYNADGRQFTYVVVEMKVVLPSEISILDPTPDETLTLVTCVPDWVYSHRFVVTAKPFPGGEALAHTQSNTSSRSSLTPIFHWVVTGETLSQIAQRYGTTPEAIAAASNLGNQNYIIVGMPLTIPRYQ
jgi:sortase A